MIYLILALAGAVVGSIALRGQGDFLMGGLIGLIAAGAINQRSRTLVLEKRLAEMEKRITERFRRGEVDALPDETSSREEKTAADGDETDGATVADGYGRTEARPQPVEAQPASPQAVTEMPSLELELADAADREPAAPPDPLPGEPAEPPGADAVRMIRQFLFGGNLMVRVGVVVLLFGFAFLVKYAAARNLVPIELRLTAAFAAGIALLVVGWRLRDRRTGYAIALQGGGIGVMYITLFAASRLFHLVPLPLTFGVMVGLVVFSGILAVLQNAVSMAVLGTAGGFLAPVLVSTGTGSHVMLFSYYALLNAGIFGIAWFKAWRWLNLLGFFFTLGIGTAWGLNDYRAYQFATTEPFLVLFFGLYLTISVLFALKQPPRLNGYVDGTLVFGMPLALFGLQAGLVKPYEYGLAFSALAMGLTYCALATALWHRRQKGLSALVEAFLALGVVFGSLAIPLALSGRWTAVAWSLEGAGLVWVGLRQRRWLARAFGLLLQFGSGILFVGDSHLAADTAVVFNSLFLGGMMLGVAGLCSAFWAERYDRRLHPGERAVSPFILVWGLTWWLGTGLGEIGRALAYHHQLVVSLVFIALNAWAMAVVHRRLDWTRMRWPPLGLLPVMILFAALCLDQPGWGHPFRQWWILAWPLAFGIHLYLLRDLEKAWNLTVAAVWHAAGALLVLFLLSWEAAWILDRLADGSRVWFFIAWGVVPALAAAALMRMREPSIWPLNAWKKAYREWVPAVLVLFLLVWSLAELAFDGDPSPLPYLPLINPLDVMQAAVFLVIAGWVRRERREITVPAGALSPAVLWGVPAAGVFLWLTAVVARSTHHLAGVAYVADGLFRSELFQAAIAVLWGLMALGCMVAASRFRQRTVWFAGAGLLVVVVGKLFVVDLSGSGTVSRIVSFLAVGGLMLVIGFFTPLPPAEAHAEVDVSDANGGRS